MANIFNRLFSRGEKVTQDKKPQVKVSLGTGRGPLAPIEFVVDVFLLEHTIPSPSPIHYASELSPRTLQ